MRRIFILLLAAALLCFAMPAIASPPGALPALEAVGPVASVAYLTPAQEAPVVAASSSIAESALSGGPASALEASIYIVLSIAIAATLAGLMRGATSPSDRLGTERGIANGFAGGRRWV
jgi:hypothetical protein